MISKVEKMGQIREKACIETTAIVNPDNGKLAGRKEQIKKVTLKYFRDTLTSNKIVEGYENTINDKKKELSKKLIEADGEFEPTG